MDRLQQFDVFVRAVHEGNFSAVARDLSLTPSAVSKIVARLEARLGVRLLQRTSRSIGLTPEGEAFYRSSVAALEAVEEAERAVVSLGTRPLGTLRLHTTPTIARYRLAPVLEAFLAAHAGLKVELLLDTRFLDLVDHRIDVAVWGEHTPDRALVQRKLWTSRSFICASPAYLARFGRPEAPADLLGHNCLNFTMTTPWNDWPLRDATKGRMVVRAAGNVAANQGEVLLELARRGVGIVRAADFHVADDLASGRLVAILPDQEASAGEAFCAFFLNRRYLSPRIRAFVDHAAAELARPSQPGSASPVMAGAQLGHAPSI